MISSNCIFCNIIAGADPSVLVYEDDICIAIMDIFPIREGHVLVIPKEHAALVHELNEKTRNHLFSVSNRINKAQRECGLPCDAVNIIVNDGKAANQHVPHIHIHLLPRIKGDLIKVALSFFTRMFKYFGQESRRVRLEKVADKIKIHIPEG